MPDEKHLFENKGNERLVLTCVLQHPELLVEVAVQLSEGDFLSEHHRALYSILNTLFSQGVEVFDLMAVVNEAADKGVLDLIGGAEYISALLNTTASVSNLDVYAGKVLDSSLKYKLYQETMGTRDKIISNLGAADTILSATELLGSAETGILGIVAEANQVGTGSNICEGLTEYIAALGDNPVEVLGLGTGIPLLDWHLNGLTPGSLTIISGRLKGGKSTLLTNVANHIAFEVGKPVLYIDTEMSTKEVITRVVANRSGVPERDISNGMFARKAGFKDKVLRSCEALKEKVFIHEYMPGFTTEAVRSVVRKYHAKDNIGAVIFDYIKMPEGNPGQFQESQILGAVTTALKDLAGKLDIPIVAGAQLKRGDSAAPKTRFNDNDVADSDKIARFCTHLLAIAPKSRKEQEEDGPSCGTHRLQVLATRSGRPCFHGIDLQCTFPTYTIKQAEHQSGGNLGERPSW